jgi:hypothetical protein
VPHGETSRWPRRRPIAGASLLELRHQTQRSTLGLLIVPSLQALNFPPALRTAPGPFVDHAMVDRTLSELQVELFNRLRATRLYSRLKNATLEPSDCVPCGWRADVLGNFSVAEHNEASEIVRDLQRRFSSRTDPLNAQHTEPKSGG